MKILCGAEPFGFGPASKLITVIDNLNREANIKKFTFVGTGTSKQFIQDNLFPNMEIYNGDALLNFPHYNFDSVISVMDYKVVAWGFYYNKPVYLIDSLFWFWNWNELYSENIKARIYQEKQKSFREFMGYLAELPGHIQMYAAHLMAESYIQIYPGLNRDKKLIDDVKPYLILPIVNKNYRSSKKRKRVIVSLSGMVNPNITKKNATTYLHIINLLFTDYLKTIEDKFEIIFVVNPSLIEKAKEIIPFKIRSYKQKDFLRILSESSLILTPPGITTIYESHFYDIPIFLLPEQHDGHYNNYLNIIKSCAEGENIFNGELLNKLYSIEEKNPKVYTDILYRLYAKIINNKFEDGIQEVWKNNIELNLNNTMNNLTDIQKNQNDALLKYFAGAAELNNILLEKIGGRYAGI